MLTAFLVSVLLLICCVCVQVTGEADQNQVCEALRRYRDRECFIREALTHLYSLTIDTDKPQPDVLKVLCSGFYTDCINILTGAAESFVGWVVAENQRAAILLMSLG